LELSSASKLNFVFRFDAEYLLCNNQKKKEKPTSDGNPPLRNQLHHAQSATVFSVSKFGIAHVVGSPRCGRPFRRVSSTPYLIHILLIHC
jgi:hypothetical protein